MSTQPSASRQMGESDSEARTNHSHGQHSPSLHIESVLALLEAQGYPCRPGTDLPTRYHDDSDDQDFSSSSGAREPTAGTLVWVLKSKGRRRRGKVGHVDTANRHENNNNSSSPIAASSSSAPPRLPSQRLELFLRARVIDPPPLADTVTQTSTQQNDGNDHGGSSPRRVWVQYPQGSTYHVRVDRLCPILPTSSIIDSSSRNSSNNNNSKAASQILVWPENQEYTKACVTHTLPADEGFVEIGCDHGGTVARVAATLDPIPNNNNTRRTKSNHSDRGNDTDGHDTSDPRHRPNYYYHVVGVDKADDSIASARKRHPQLTFVQWDCLSAATFSSSSSSPSSEENNDEDPDASRRVHKNENDLPVALSRIVQPASPPRSFILAIDIGGNRALSHVLQCLQRLLVDLQWRPRLVLVKSRALWQALVEKRQS